MMALSKADQALVDAFLASKSLRRFEQGDTAEEYNLIDYLRRKGVKATHITLGHIRVSHPYRIDGKPATRATFLEIVNKHRADDGLSPIGSAQ